MYKNRFPTALVGMMALMVLFGTANADPPFSQYKDKASGSLISTVIDTNGDGVPGAFGILQGTSTFGKVMIHFFSEYDLDSPALNADCPVDFVELPIVASNTIYSYENGDLLYFVTTSEVLCGNLATGEFQWHETLDVIGGTGRFANANGTLEVTGSGKILISDALGVTSFGGISLSANGRVKLHSN